MKEKNRSGQPTDLAYGIANVDGEREKKKSSSKQENTVIA